MTGAYNSLQNYSSTLNYFSFSNVTTKNFIESYQIEQSQSRVSLKNWMFIYL